jgi:hypothetical protein
MNTTAKLGLALIAFATLGYADTWTGKLVDANCSETSQNQPPAPDSNGKTTIKSCAATPSTASFAIQTSDGKVYRLDPAGNSKAATAIRGNPDNKSPVATVSGALEGDILKVDSISVQ